MPKGATGHWAGNRSGYIGALRHSETISRGLNSMRIARKVNENAQLLDLLPSADRVKDAGSASRSSSHGSQQSSLASWVASAYGALCVVNMLSGVCLLVSLRHMPGTTTT